MSATRVIHPPPGMCSKVSCPLGHVVSRDNVSSFCRSYECVVLSFSGRGMVGMVGVVVGMLLTLREGISAADAPLRRPRAAERRGAVRGVAGAEEGLLHAMLR